jgi:hypothetical protein
MTSFFQLFKKNSPGPNSVEDPARVDRELPTLVKASPLRWWHVGDDFGDEGVRLLIGVATWSGYDMRLLDVIAAALAHAPKRAPSVDVFNIADCRQLHDLRSHVPKLRQVFHTPIVGVWREGQLVESREGYEARDLVARMFGSGSAEIVAFVDDWLRTHGQVQKEAQDS